MRPQSDKDIEKDFLEPAFKYLVGNGLENTSVRDLCKAMKISYGSLYYWFDGKNDIYTSVVNYGISKVKESLFQVAFERMSNPKLFFETFLDDVKKHSDELRLIFQFATSPEYGPSIRNGAFDFKEIYGEYIEKLAEMNGCSTENMATVIYMLISILVDFVVWDDIEASSMQMKFLYNAMVGMKDKN